MMCGLASDGLGASKEYASMRIAARVHSFSPELLCAAFLAGRDSERRVLLHEAHDEAAVVLFVENNKPRGVTKRDTLSVNTWCDI